jgi:glycyl-tRNA synthetase alpha chain
VVVLKPAPENILDLYLAAGSAGFESAAERCAPVEDDWEARPLGAWGLGWEVWLNGMEATQFTYSSRSAGFDCKPAR